MTTRKSMEEFLYQCQQTVEFAQEQFIEDLKQGHFHDQEYSEAQQRLEDQYNELMAVYRSANAEQRDRLHRMRLQIQSLQNEMTLLDHH
mgnify:CR=1 FL=1